MPSAYSKEYNYFITWSAKSGCTMFRKLFLELHSNELSRLPKNKWHSLDGDFPIPIHVRRVNIKNILLCRNPYHRVVSMFTNKK